jgi:NDP-sugar pyrophosphorylase family protein
MNEKTDERIISNVGQTDLKSFAFSGIQILSPKIFQYFPDKDIFSLVELYLSAAGQEKICGYLHNEDLWMDLGKKENLNNAEQNFDTFRNIYQV